MAGDGDGDGDPGGATGAGDAVDHTDERRRVESLRRDFVANASHELKTPVAGILALSESLEIAFDRDPERARAMVGRLRVEAERLSQLVRELLDLTRLEDMADRIGEKRQASDLTEIVALQAERLRAEADTLKVALNVAADDAVEVSGNPADLRLIVANLLENAVRYNRPGGEVRVSVQRDGADAIVEVADTGVGIPADDLDRIFERFYRVDKARSRLAGGTGLGLSIVRHAVESHGGSISVDSEVGRGTTFRVTLPLEPRAQ